MHRPAEAKQDREGHGNAGWRDSIYTRVPERVESRSWVYAEVRGAVDWVARPWTPSQRPGGDGGPRSVWTCAAACLLVRKGCACWPSNRFGTRKHVRRYSQVDWLQCQQTSYSRPKTRAKRLAVDPGVGAAMAHVCQTSRGIESGGVSVDEPQGAGWCT